MTVDQQRRTQHGIGVVAGEVDIVHGGRRDGVQARGRVGAEIVGTDDRMIDVDEQAAASAGTECGEKRRLNVGGRLSKI